MEGLIMTPLASRWTILGLFASLWLAAAPARACFGIRVTHPGDDRVGDNGTCTLREAIRATNQNTAVDGCPSGAPDANTMDRICLPAGTFTIDLSLSGQPESPAVGDLDVTGRLEIVGLAADVTTVVGTNGDGQPLLSISDDAELVVIRDATLSQASDSGGVLENAEATSTVPVLIANAVLRGGRADQGGGIRNSGVLQVSGSLIEANSAAGNGGGILNENGTLTIHASELVDNEAGGDGGGIHTSGGKLILSQSRIVDNRAPAGRGGGVYVDSDFEGMQYNRFEDNQASAGGGFYLNTGTGEIFRSAFVRNSASATGGGVDARQSTAIRFSTFTQNSAANGGAVFAKGPQVLLDADTVAGNLGGGGIYNEQGAFVENVLLANNAGGSCAGLPVGFGAFNLEDADSCHLVDSANQPNFPNTQPLLGALAENGGPTPTLALLPGSPAIDVVSSAIRTNCEKMPDQRGYPRGRPRTNIGGNDVFFCDIGAYEHYTPFAVDTGLDGADADPADDRCASATGACTLRAAVQQANATPGFDVIELAARTHTLSLAGAGENVAATGDLDLTAPLLIRGVGPASAIDAARLDRAFDVTVPLEPGVNGYTLRDLRVTRGSPPAGENGGALRGAEGGVRLERVLLDDNRINGFGNGSAVFVRDPIMFNRRARHALELLASAVTNNVGNMPVYATDGLIARSAIHGNLQDQRGSEFTAVRVENSTFSGNQGGSWGAFFANQAFVDASTIYANSVTSEPGAVFLLELSALRNSILANNLVNGAIQANCSMNEDGIQSLGHNLADTPASDCALTDPTDRVLAAPLLDPLADNGGGTPTHALQAGSPAIDAGDDAACLAVDQRGFVRPADGDGDALAKCDIGAFERGAGSDLDGDGIFDASDNCPFFANLDQDDSDTDGRGDACECSDQNGDGQNTVSDLIAINTAIFNPSLATPLCDGNNDGACTVSDIVAANVEIFSPGSTATCARQPVPGP
jgi:CSLREA domain-containing protein